MSEPAQPARDILAELLRDIDTLVAQNLADPDLRDRSAEFREGYARGMREAMVTFLRDKLKHKRDG